MTTMSSARFAAIAILPLSLALSAQALAKSSDAKPFDYMPKGGYAPTVAAEFVEPSTTKAIKPGQKISNLTKRNFAGDTIIQKLTDKSYWVQNGFYSTSFYVGKKGVLLLDPLGWGKGPAVLKAVKSITDKPVTAVIYSHQHEDHIGDIEVFIKDAKKRGVKLDIIATDDTVAEMKKNGSKLPEANVIVSKWKNTAKFEDQNIKVIRFKPSAHSHDSVAWLLEGEKLIHSPDIVNPNQLPYHGFGGSHTFTGFRDNLEQLKKGDWQFFSAGHGNIGSKKDVDFMITYVDDLVANIKDAGAKVNFGEYFVGKYNNHQAAVHAYNMAVENYVMQKLRVKYGDMYGFEASVPYQIKMVQASLE